MNLGDFVLLKGMVANEVIFMTNFMTYEIEGRSIWTKNMVIVNQD